MNEAEYRSAVIEMCEAHDESCKRDGKLCPFKDNRFKVCEKSDIITEVMMKKVNNWKMK